MPELERRVGERRTPQTWQERWKWAPIDRRRYWPHGRRASEGGSRLPVR
jgi:hypothetical protein